MERPAVLALLFLLLSTPLHAERDKGDAGKIQQIKLVHSSEGKKGDAEGKKGDAEHAEARVHGEGGQKVGVFGKAKAEAELAEARVHQQVDTTTTDVECLHHILMNLRTEMQTKIDDQATPQNKREQAERVKHDINWFLCDVSPFDIEGSDHLRHTKKDDVAHATMFVMSMRVRLRTLGLSDVELICDPEVTREMYRNLDMRGAGEFKIYFGQGAVGKAFSGNNQNSQAAFGNHRGQPLNAQIDGQDLFAVAARMLGNNPAIPLDGLPVQVAQTTNGKWFSLNNRGFTAHNLAKLRPLRILPRAMSIDEKKNRFAYADNPKEENRQERPGLPALDNPRSHIWLENFPDPITEEVMQTNLQQFPDQGNCREEHMTATAENGFNPQRQLLCKLDLRDFR